MTALAFMGHGSRTPRLPALREWVGARLPTGGLSEIPGRLPGAGESRWFQFMAGSFAILVLVPVVLTAFYVLALASNRYVADARFAIRSSPEATTSAEAFSSKPKKASKDRKIGGGDLNSSDRPSSPMASFGGLFGGGSGSGSAADPYVIAEYIVSRAMVSELDRDGRLRNLYSAPTIDRLSRLDPAVSAERLRQYWSDRVRASVDRLSGMITLRVTAFAASDAASLAEEIIRSSERLVNTLAERRRADTVRLAEAELRRSEQRYMDALIALRDFRTAQASADPQRALEQGGKALLELEAEQVKLEAQRSGLKQQLSETASILRPLDARIAAVRREIEGLTEQMASDRARARSAAASMAGLEAHEMERSFAERVYQMAESGLARAREEAARQHEYLTVFVRPSVPERPDHGALYGNVGVVFILGLFAWGFLLLVVASVLDQKA